LTITNFCTYQNLLFYACCIILYVACYAVGLLVERDEKYGGNVKYAIYEEMEDAYAKEVSHVVVVAVSVC